jgi:hypothetical protein
MLNFTGVKTSSSVDGSPTQEPISTSITNPLAAARAVVDSPAIRFAGDAGLNGRLHPSAAKQKIRKI